MGVRTPFTVAAATPSVATIAQVFHNSNCTHCISKDGAGEATVINHAKDVRRVLSELPNHVIPDVDVSVSSNSLNLYAYNVTFNDKANTGNQYELALNWAGCTVDGCQPRYDGVRLQTIYSKPDLVLTDDASNTYITSGSSVSANTASNTMTMTLSGAIASYSFATDPGPDFLSQFTSAEQTPYVYVDGMGQDGVCTVSRTTAPTATVLTCEAFTTNDGTTLTGETKTSSSTITFTEAHSYLATYAGGDLVTLYGANTAFNIGPDNSGSSADNPKLFYNRPNTDLSVAMSTRKDRIALQGTAEAAASGIATIILSKTLGNTANWATGSITAASTTGNLKEDLAKSATTEITRGTTEATECAGRGVCDTDSGTCVCHDGYRGEACQSQTVLI
jgi:hypothetical protein